MKLKSLYHTLLACCLIFIGSCKNEATTSAKNEILFRSVTEKEYQAASPVTKALIDKIDASINALNIIKADTSVEYEAFIFISNDETKKIFQLFKNALLISPIESDQTDSEDKATSLEKPTVKFKICKPRASFAFIKAIEAYRVKNKEDGLSLTIKTVGDCIQISYE